MQSWLASVGFEGHENVIGNYVSESTALKDLFGMLVAEQEDEDSEAVGDGLSMRCPMCREVVETTMTCFS